MRKLLASLLFIPALALAGVTADQGMASQTSYSAWRVQGSTVTSDTPVVTAPSPGNTSAFGEPLSVERVNVLSLEFVYNINSYFAATTTANGGTVTQATSMAVLQTSTATNGSALLESKGAVRYVAGTGTYTSFTALYTTCVANSQQEAGLGDADDGFFIGCQGANFGVFLRKGGVDTFVAQANWSLDKLDGTGPSRLLLVKTNLTLFKISFGWHGSGPVKFYIFDLVNGRWVLFHVISSGVTSTRVLHPTLPLHVRVVNSGNATNLTVKIGSMGAYREGGPSPAPDAVSSAPASASGSKAVTTEAAVLSVQNLATVFSGQGNHVRVRINDVFAVNVTGAVSCTVRVLLNTTLGGAPSFTSFDANTSVMASDTAGTTVSGGRLVYTFTVTQNVAAGSVAAIDLSNKEIVLNPGDTLTFTATSSGAAQTVFISVNWSELFTG